METAETAGSAPTDDTASGTDGSESTDKMVIADAEAAGAAALEVGARLATSGPADVTAATGESAAVGSAFRSSAAWRPSQPAATISAMDKTPAAARSASCCAGLFEDMTPSSSRKAYFAFALKSSA